MHRRPANIPGRRFNRIPSPPKAEPAMRPIKTKVRFYPILAALLILASVSRPALAFPNKDMIELQTKVQQLLDAVARLQQSNDERMGMLKDLVQQNSDSVNRMSVTVDALQKQVAAQLAASGTKVDTVSGQVQALTDSFDELKARMIRLEKAVALVSSQQQTMGAAIENLAAPPAAAPGSAAPGSATPPASTPPSAAIPPAALPPVAPAPVTADAAPPAAPIVRKVAPATLAADDMYKNAVSDFMGGRFPVAGAEFGDIVRSYPDSTLAGNAYFYLGEIDYHNSKFSTAVKDYDKVIEQYPDNTKVQAAHLHKGQALIQMQMKDAGIREFRTLIQRYPSSPEALQATNRLKAMNVPVKPKP